MSRVVLILIVPALVAGCMAETPSPTAPISVPIFNQSASASPDGTSASLSGSPNANGGNFGTPLAPGEEVMPTGVVNTSEARGNAIFQLNAAGTELSYKLIVANIENVFQAHIHRGPAGVNGPIVVWLYPSTAVAPGPLGGGRLDGVIAEGTIRANNLIGQLLNHPLSDLINDLKNGNAYVNAHTNDGVSPTNTGPGDFPGGEIRGQVEHRGH